MSVPESAGSGASPSLFASIRSFWGVAVAILYTRLDLVTTELEDEAKRGIKLIIFGLVGVHCLFMAFFFAMFFIIALVWDTPYVFWVIGGIVGLFFVSGAVLLIAARDMIMKRPPFLSQTLTELRRDVDGLSRSLAPKKEETRP